MATITNGGLVSKQSLFDESSSEVDQEDGGAQLQINKEYAQRFEYNKKREELHRLEEKFKKRSETSGKDEENDDSADCSESDDENEYLMTEDLDNEISATLQAIKNKDPRIYDKSAVFYQPADPDAEPAQSRKEKPIFLRDYQREQYMKGDTGADVHADAKDQLPPTYFQEQEAIKKSIVSEINAVVAATDNAEDEDWSGDDDFLKPKAKLETSEETGADGVHSSGQGKANVNNLKLTENDVANAEKDPENYLFKFMAAAKATETSEGLQWAAFESDDDDDEAAERADKFEHAYNMRFEDPEISNEVLKSYSRTVAAARTVRKELLTGRKKQRLLEKERKEAEKRRRHEERARLKKLKLDEAAQKLAKIKEAAGISGKPLNKEEWIKFLDEAWDDDQWEEEMSKRFGDDYYAEADNISVSDDKDDDEGSGRNPKKKLKKPKWNDDIDIKDIIPDFEDDNQPGIIFSDAEVQEQPADVERLEADSSGDEDDDEEYNARPAKKRKMSKTPKEDRKQAKKQRRQELVTLEALVEAKMELEQPTTLSKSGKTSASSGGFRYRETSPITFGLTARDILLAPSDAALNEFAGLKKLASFRDADKKRRDKKRLGRKARLREWRRETFGKQYEVTGPTYGFEEVGLVDVGEKERRRERKRMKSVRRQGKEREGEEVKRGGETNGGEREKIKKRKRSKVKKAVGA